MADSKFSLLFLSWSFSLLSTSSILFLLSSILCSFSQIPFSLSSPLPLSPHLSYLDFPCFFFPRVITHPSDMSQYCLEVHCRHILVSCCYVFNPSKLTFLYPLSLPKGKPIKIFDFYMICLFTWKSLTQNGGRGRRWGNRIYSTYSQKKKKKGQSSELFKLDPFLSHLSCFPAFFFFIICFIINLLST